MAKVVELVGLDELINELSPSNAANSLSKQTKKTTSALDKAIQSAIKKKFTAGTSINLLSNSTKSVGNSVEGKLTYQQTFSDLSKFPTTWKLGNINSGAKRLGRVHTTTVVKGKPNIIVGREHRGGFILLTKSGRRKKFGRFGTQMVERRSKKKLPLRLLLGASTNMMVSWAIRKDPLVIATIASLKGAIVEGVF